MTPEAVFYTHLADPDGFACRLVRKLYREGHRLLLWADSPGHIQILSSRLWQFPTDFLAHDIWPHGEAMPAHSRLLLGSAPVPTAPPAGWTVINLGQAYWSAQPAPPHLIELTADDETALAAARQRFRYYRSQGFRLNHHNMQGKG